MADIRVVTVLWSGFPGGPGTSTFHFTNVELDLTALHDFYGALLGIIPNSVHLEVRNSGAVVDDATGDLMDTWAEAPVTTMMGSNTAAYASGVGCVVRWDTGVVVDKRSMVGHTFLVPLYGGAFDVDGTLNTDDKGLIQTQATELVTGYDEVLLMWHRPRKAKLGPPAVSERAGSSHVITGGTVIDRTAVLTSRRG